MCSECGYSSPRWLGRCPECRSWDTMVEETVSPEKETRMDPTRPPRPLTLDQVPLDQEDRLPTGLTELDRVLGGGLVPGAVVLLAGEPGIGKSTLLLQAASGLAEREKLLLYVSGEESPAQLRLRATRLGLDLTRLMVVSETTLETIITLAESHHWDLLALDSVQSIGSARVASGTGSLAQIREAAGRLITLAKKLNRPVWLVGHVNKEGSIAGPKVLEHMVDTVLYFEGERGYNLRILRSFKNRFGSINEIGVFEMKDRGLSEVTNPSALFLAERPINAPGSVVVPTVEGTRPILIELQALVSVSSLAMPRRQALGIDPARLSLLTAVLEKKAGLRLYDRDVFVNVTGGVKIIEPAADLGLAAALASCYFDRPVDHETVFVGEIGLAGEVRAVGRTDIRLREAKKLGFKKAVIPRTDLERLGPNASLELVPVSSITDLLAWLN